MANTRLFNNDYSATWPEPLKKINKKFDAKTWQPILVKMGEKNSSDQLNELVQQNKIIAVIDNYDDQIGELVISRNPHLYRSNLDVKRNSVEDLLKDHYGNAQSWQMGTWVYYPWSEQLVHVLAEDLFEELRTIRNRDLITDEEQKKFSMLSVGCLGMSVGSSAAAALVIQGGSKNLKIADSAVISGSNLNRIRTGVMNVGLDKSVVMARELYEMDPYLRLSKTPSISKETLEDFFAKPWPLHLVVDEVDDLEIKIRLRIEARKRRIPVLMATDLGDDVMLDIERFDKNHNLPLFHGLVGVIEDVLNRSDISHREWLKYATQIIGSKNVPLRMQKSLLKVGTKLVTQPQLGGTAMIAGAVVAYAARQIAIGANLKSGRVMISIDSHLIQGHTGFSQRRRHSKHTKILDRSLKSM